MGNVSRRGMLPIGLHITVLLFVVSGEGMFEKHFGHSLSEPSRITSIYNDGGALECEKHCLFQTPKCTAANLILINANFYNCEIFADLPADFNTNMLRSNPKGRFIHRIGWLTECFYIL